VEGVAVGTGVHGFVGSAAAAAGVVVAGEHFECVMTRDGFGRVAVLDDSYADVDCSTRKLGTGFRNLWGEAA